MSRFTRLRYIKSYSPYDNLTHSPRPNLLVLSSLNDTRVPFWGPTKWVAKMRADKTDDRLLLLKSQMNAGHAGTSARYDVWEESARLTKRTLCLPHPWKAAIGSSFQSKTQTP